MCFHTRGLHGLAESENRTVQVHVNAVTSLAGSMWKVHTAGDVLSRALRTAQHRPYSSNPGVPPHRSNRPLGMSPIHNPADPTSETQQGRWYEDASWARTRRPLEGNGSPVRRSASAALRVKTREPWRRLQSLTRASPLTRKVASSPSRGTWHVARCVASPSELRRSGEIQPTGIGWARHLLARLRRFRAKAGCMTCRWGAFRWLIQGVERSSHEEAE